jgi:autotransporter-associated beta strand protein
VIAANRGITVGAAGGTINTTRTVTYGGVVAGSGTFTKAGLGGTLILTGSNTFTGGLATFGGGFVEVSSDANLGAVPGTLKSDAIVLANSGSSGRMRFTDSFMTAATRGITINVGGTLGGYFEVAADKTLTIAGPITGGGQLRKTGSGSLVIAGTANYAGPTTVSSGTLTVNGVIGGTSAVTLSGGATLAGTGTVNGATRIAAFSTLSPGASPGTLAFGGNLTLAAGGDYNWQMLSATGTAGATNAWDLVTVSGTLDITATSADPFAINLWSLSSTSPDTSGSAANFDPTQNSSWTIARATGGITGFAADAVVVTTSATNGTGGFANDLAGGTFSLAQSGNSLNLVFTASGGAPSVITINVANGTQTQAAAGYPLLSGATPVVKTGAGTLVVDQANPLTGSTTVQEGVLQLANGSALSSSTLAVAAGGTAQVANYLTTSVAGLDLAGNGLVDVTSGFMTVAGGLSATALVAEILEGRGTGTWTGTSGITSSVAAADVALGIPRTVGWLDNGNGSVSFAFAAPGDTNLDWQVDVLDAANVITGGKFNTGAAATWAQGDFNYDGLVNILDAADFITTGLYNQGPYNQSPGAVGAVAAVPEPALGLAGIALLTATAALFARRR